MAVGFACYVWLYNDNGSNRNFIPSVSSEFDASHAGETTSGNQPIEPVAVQPDAPAGPEMSVYEHRNQLSVSKSINSNPQHKESTAIRAEDSKRLSDPEKRVHQPNSEVDIATHAGLSTAVNSQRSVKVSANTRKSPVKKESFNSNVSRMAAQVGGLKITESQAAVPKRATSVNSVAEQRDISKADAEGMRKEIRLSSDPAAVANRRLMLARKLYKQGRPREAEELLKQTLAEVKDAPFILHQLASWMLTRSADAEVLTLLNDVSRDSSPELRQTKAHALLSLGLQGEALELLQSNLPPIASHRSFHTMRAGLLQRHGRFNEALAVYTELVESDPLRGAFWAGLGISLEQTGNRVSAVKAFRKALADPELNPRLAQYAELRTSAGTKYGEL